MNYPSQTFSDHNVGGQCALLLDRNAPDSTVDDCTVISSGYHWALKITANRGSVIRNTVVHGGMSRGIDIVRCKQLVFENVTVTAGADRAGKVTKSKWKLGETCDIGAKGHSTDLRFNGCTFTDILLGDHTIYDNPTMMPKTSGVVLTDCVHPNGPGTPIIIRCLNAEMPILIRTNAIAMVYCDFVVKTYYWIAGKWIDSRIGVQLPA